MRISLTGGDRLAVEERKGEGEERTRGLLRKLGPWLGKRIRGLGRGEKERGMGFPLGPEQEERMACWAKLLLGLRKCEGGFGAFGPKQKKGRFPFFFSFVLFYFYFFISKSFQSSFKSILKKIF